MNRRKKTTMAAVTKKKKRKQWSEECCLGRHKTDDRIDTFSRTVSRLSLSERERERESAKNVAADIVPRGFQSEICMKVVCVQAVVCQLSSQSAGSE